MVHAVETIPIPIIKSDALRRCLFTILLSIEEVGGGGGVVLLQAVITSYERKSSKSLLTLLRTMSLTFFSKCKN